MVDYEALDGAVGENWYELDPDLQLRVRQDSPAEDSAWADGTLRRFGALVGGEVARNADVSDADPPRLVRWDRWAEEVSEVEHSAATLASKRALWSAGYVSGFAADEVERGRPTPGVVHGAANYLLSQADTGLVCSLGMTSGVAGLVAAYAPPDVRDPLLAGLRADDVDSGTDGSMFLTEREGGSDLGRTVHCTATDIGDGRVLISGEKWFCSNVDGAAIVLLARPEGAPEGPAGLGLYLVPRQLDTDHRNSFTIRRLKDKLGTKSVPTGEVVFDEALGYALRREGGGGGGDAGGLGRMMEMVNGSRFGVAMMGLGIARRCFLESAIWAHHRRAKGRALVDLPLVREALVDQQAELEAAFALGFECSAAGRRPDGARLRRITVPAAKVRLCRLGVEQATATIELHGGNGYCEDWGLTRQLRDAQCHTIWEGTENICAIDVLRATRRDNAHEAVLDRIDVALGVAASGPGFTGPAVDAVAAARDRLSTRVDALPTLDADRAEAGALTLTALISSTLSTALLLEQAASDDDRDGLGGHKGLLALRMARRHLGAEGAEDDRSADLVRDLLAFAPIEEGTAAKVV